jgi:hypothetical protein
MGHWVDAAKRLEPTRQGLDWHKRV